MSTEGQRSCPVLFSVSHVSSWCFCNLRWFCFYELQKMCVSELPLYFCCRVSLRNAWACHSWPETGTFCLLKKRSRKLNIHGFISSHRFPIFLFLINSPLVSRSPSTTRVSSYSWRPTWRMTSLRNCANTSSLPSRARMAEAAPLTPLDLEQACWVNSLL